ncbi:flagellar assembly protein FliH [Paenibacillus sambharensis]|uniref:Flagellar assembly protein FliH n=1 Tax=Paenibacillus sambharensis TaxID=1803190 RepID=A0A2W1L2N1_9BACL|nr:FliH/SctL family protein [Paenibacillus sambharensis]PZD93323.1 flagellar assembly protein FliH [Paenibacillus sambharensis]
MSNLIKSSHVVSLEELKLLEWTKHHASRPFETAEAEEEEQQVPDQETISLKEQILRDAEFVAEQRVSDAAEEAERRLQEANDQIEQWWQERRDQDLQLTESAREAGFEQGYLEGQTHAALEVKQLWEARLAEAGSLLENAYRLKEQIIQEAEPFLVELSTRIAEKIIGQQLTISPEIAIELARKSLQRRREQGVITLCVAPSQLAFVQAAREELSLAIDSQAELQIVPDATVKDHGCVIRSSFGSIDARIDTQLEEIKRELIQIALQSEEQRQADDHEFAT